MCSCEFIHTNDMHFTTRDFSPLSFMLNSIRGNCVLSKVAHCDTAWKKSTKYGENPLKKKGRVRPETLLYVTTDGVNETLLNTGVDVNITLFIGGSTDFSPKEICVEHIDSLSHNMGKEMFSKAGYVQTQ
jgi:hypothetical protein